jgi:sugar lactone lactonase YvrE
MSGGLEGAPNPIQVTSIPAGSAGSLPASARAFVKSTRTTNPKQVKSKDQNSKQLYKAKMESKPSPRYRESRMAPDVPTLVHCAEA